MPHKDNAKPMTPKDPATSEESDPHQSSDITTSQVVSSPKKPKTRKYAKAEKRPTPAMKKQLNHFTRRHKFVSEQSFGTYTTSQRRAFERDVYDYSRALGLAKSRAKASVLSARRLCGEEDYNSDDTRLDDDEMDDSSVILVSLPASTGPATSTLGRSFSATSPTIPRSSNPRRSNSEVLPSVETQETPVGDVGKSERNPKRKGTTIDRGKKRRKTSDETLDPTLQEDGNDTGTVATPSASLVELQRTQSKRRKSKGQNGQLTDIPNATGSAVQSQNDARVEIERPMAGGHSTNRGERSAKTGKEEKHENNRHVSKGSLSESRKAERKERKRQGRRQSKKLLFAEKDESPLSAGATPDGRKDEMSQIPQESTRQGVHRDGKSADENDEPSRDQSMNAWARDLLRVQDAARRAKEERERAGMASDAEMKVQNQEDATSVSRNELKMTNSKKSRKSDALSSTPTDFQTCEDESQSKDQHCRSNKDKDFSLEEIIFPSTPVKSAKSSTASSPLSSLPSTPRWPTPSRNIVKGEEQENSISSTRKKRKGRPKSSLIGSTSSKTHGSSTKFSPYFPLLPKPPQERVSCIPFPPLRSTSFGLVQEDLASTPFHLLIAVIFLNKTRGSVAMPVFYSFKARFPDASSLAAADHAEVVSFFQNLGLQNQRAKKCIALAKAWLEHPPAKGKRWRRLHYPKLGDGKDIKSSEEAIADETEDPRVAWEVGHLPGIGAYATLPELPANSDADARKSIEGVEMRKEWTRVLPLDKELRAYLRWRWLRLGWEWDPTTGERRKAEENTVKEAERGGVILEGDKGWSLGNVKVEEDVRQMRELCEAEHGNWKPKEESKSDGKSIDNNRR
ncbi:MAG: hypothetical protein Q9182_001488 [Xanthomendoza sp. 2 TL-2023]